jgi:N-acetylneuraminic acid mutarotase
VTGANYTVTVKTQPSTPTQTCTISNSTGVVASANVTQIMVLCPQIYNPSLTNAWTWFIGDNQGFPSAGIPGSRSNFATWVDRAGNLWMFGGLTWNGIVDEGGDIGDLWYYSPATGLWTLVIGGDVPPSGGVWGTEGTAAAGNIPSGRDSEAVWTDAAGNFWLFGGEGLDSTRTDGILNDLWEYTPSTGFWTWVGGSSTAGAVGVYGTKGVASTSNVPGARIGATTWIDTSGNLWLFGGQMSPSTQETLNDLWKYNPANATWTWVSGASDVANSAGIYGTKGTASSSNSPGARYYANSFKDTSGNLWLFGGYGYDLAGKLNLLNDLWRFSPTTRTWTWIGGTDVGGALGIYGAQGTPSTANAPGARYGANAWTDAAGNFWLFAGNGFDSVGSKGDFAPQIGLNDLWKYDPTAGTWEWVSGSDIGGASSVFGTSGLASTSSMPGAQFGGGSWTDAAGHLWMFGGIPEVGAPGAPPLYLGALWVYTPAAP